jgi:tetratricopeptide (TPR) repeat protein
MAIRHLRRETLLAAVVAALLVAGCAKQEKGPPAVLDAGTQQLLARGEQAVGEREYERALALVDSAARRAPTAVEPDFLRGLIYSHTMRWEQAEQAYRRVIDRNPAFPGVWNNLGNNALRQARYREALAYYERELARQPAAVPWSSVGRVYRELGIVDSAIYAFERAIDRDSAYVPAYLAYAGLLEDEGAYAQALTLAQDAYRLAPNSVEAQYRLGSLLSKVGRNREAIPHLEAVTEVWPWHTESHYELARVLQQVGRDEESRALLARAEVLWRLQADVTASQKGISTEPENPYAHAVAATAYRMAGRYEEAVEAYKVALSLDPGNLEFQNNLASLYFLKKDTTAAIRTYQRILKQDPKMTEVWINLGVLCALAGERAAARQAWQQVLAYDPENAEARGYLAKLDGGP